MATHRLAHHRVSGWVVGFAILASSIMILDGICEIFLGLAAIFNNNFFVVGPNYIYNISVTTWGWIHLFIGAVVALAGMFVFTGQGWARGVGIVLALISAVANFLYIPYYPIWSLLIVALDIAVIWALASYSSEAATAEEEVVE